MSSFGRITSQRVFPGKLGVVTSLRVSLNLQFACESNSDVLEASDNKLAPYHRSFICASNRALTNATPEIPRKVSKHSYFT